MTEIEVRAAREIEDALEAEVAMVCDDLDEIDAAEFGALVVRRLREAGIGFVPERAAAT